MGRESRLAWLGQDLGYTMEILKKFHWINPKNKLMINGLNQGLSSQFYIGNKKREIKWFI